MLVVEVFVACVLKLIILICYYACSVIGVSGTSILLQIPNIACPKTWRHVLLGDNGYIIY